MRPCHHAVGAGFEPARALPLAAFGAAAIGRLGDPTKTYGTRRTIYAMSDQIMPPEEQDPAEPRGLGDADSILTGGGSGDVVFHGLGMFRPWDLGVGPRDLRRTKPRGGFRWASY